MTLDQAQNIAFRMANLNSGCITLQEIQNALVVLGNFYEDYKTCMAKDDPDHPDYIDPYLRDGENQNYN